MTTSSQTIIYFAGFMGVNALLILLIAMRISLIRMTKKIPYGDGAYRPLQQAVRAHANGVEHVPLFALCLLALIGLGFSEFWLLVLMSTFTLSRISHACGMLFKQFNLRRIGAGFSYLSEGGAVVALAYCLSTYLR